MRIFSPFDLATRHYESSFYLMYIAKYSVLCPHNFSNTLSRFRYRTPSARLTLVKNILSLGDVKVYYPEFLHRTGKEP
jgi:hypothetical protein